LCFVAGLWVLLKPSVSRPVPAGAAGRVTRRVGWLFAFIGVGTLVLGAWLTWRGGTTAATWVAVDAESVAARPISTMGGRRQGGPRYDVQVTFRYVAGGRPFESDTTSGMASASPQLRDERMAQFAPGSRHRIYHRPDDPNIIRYQPESFFGLFALPAGMGLMGLLFLAFGAAMLRVRPDPGPAGPPDIDAEDRLIAQQQRFRR
jgi:hypothetical protein